MIENEDYIDYIVQKIIWAHEKNIKLDSRGFIWDCCNDHHKNVPVNKENLENMANTELIFGFFGLSDSRENPETIRNTLFKLAVGLGCQGLQNPEGGCNPRPIINNRELSNDELLDEIEKHIGFRIHLPEFTGGQQVLRTGRGIITTRILNYLLVMNRIILLCPDTESSIIEIGGGMGILGYFLDKAGYKDYTNIDLATANACQTYFLARNLPEREIIMSGDQKNPFDLNYKKCLKILHASDFKASAIGRFDLMINMDSFTEMVKQDAINYMRSKAARIILSINHEMNAFRVCDIMEYSYRFPFWLRDGYVEELYEPTDY